MEWRLDGRMGGSTDKWKADGTHQQALSPSSYLSACPHRQDSCVSPGVLSPLTKVSLPSIQCFSFALLVDSDSEPKCLWKYNQQSLQLRSPAWRGWRSDASWAAALLSPHGPGPSFTGTPLPVAGQAAVLPPAALVGSPLLIFPPAWLLSWLELNSRFSSPSPPLLKSELNDNTVIGRKSLSSSDAPFYLDSSPTWSDEPW